MRSVAAALCLALLAAPAVAAPLTFFGEDLNSNESVRLATRPNADAAHSNFLAAFSGASVETFEGFAASSTPVTLTFPGAGTGTLTGTGQVLSVSGTATLSGQYPISGTKFLDDSQDFTLTFSQPMIAFGFYGTDIGDHAFAGQIQLTFTGAGAPFVSSSMGTIGNDGGSALFFGYVDTANPFTSIAFNNSSFFAFNPDFFGFDDFTVGAAPQVVPIPAALPLFGSALAGLGALRLKRRRRAAARVS